MKLYYVILGATPPGRNIEQHDVFFGIADNLHDLIPEMKQFWTGAKIHIDAWMEVTSVDGYKVSIQEKSPKKQQESLYFINLGGYKPGCFLEFHEQLLTVANSPGEAIKTAKATAFYKEMGFAGAVSHVDDKHGVDVDEIYNITDLLSNETKLKYSIFLEKATEACSQPEMNIGYLKIS